MDSSRSYIRMCAGARDLQNLWVRSYGDVITQDMETTCCWLPDNPPDDDVRQGYRIRRESKIVHISRCVWLPRLDQLMELAQQPNLTFDQTTQAFFRFCNLPYGNAPPPRERFDTLEQMWLGFVMQRRFHQRWTTAGDWRMIGGEVTN